MGFFPPKGLKPKPQIPTITNGRSIGLDYWKQNHKNCVEYFKKYAYPENIDLVYDNNSNTINFKDDNRIQYFYSKLNIIRINSTIDIPLGTVEYIDNIITNGDLPSFDINDENDNGLSTLYPNGNPYTMSELKKFIPIFLVNEGTMPDITIPDDNELDKNKDEYKKRLKVVEALGFYFSKGDGKFYPNRPCIYLCPERIMKMTEGLFDANNKPITLSDGLKFAVTLIHELGHAIMDTTNYPVETTDSQGNVIVLPNKKKVCSIDNGYSKNLSYFKEEEKCANRIMLNYMERWDNLGNMEYNSLEMIKTFVQKQPIGYNEAVEANEDCWRDHWNKKNKETK